MPDPFTCPFCSSISHNPNDLEQRYCARCSVFVDDAITRREKHGACRGYPTTEVQSAEERMEHCVACGCEVRVDLVEHHYFGFKAGCVWREPHG